MNVSFIKNHLLGVEVTIYTMGGQVITGEIIEGSADNEQEIVIIKDDTEDYIIVNVNAIEMIK
ncbi:hypothetical protein [Halanaerobaculum tunisiense]